MTDTNTKIRSLFLAGLVVLSVFAGTIAFAGSAAAANVDQADSDTNLNSGDVPQGLHWQGQDVYFTGDTGDANKDYSLHEYNADTQSVGDFVSVISLDGDNEAIIDTSAFNGRFVVVDETGNPLVFTNGSAASGNASAAEFTVATQTLSANIAASSTNQDTTTVNLKSNRGTYQATVDANNLSDSELATVFGTADVDNSTDGYQVQVSSNNEQLNMDFSSIAAGDYTFEFDVVDTDAGASDSITVNTAADASAQFGQAVYQEERGDIAEITVNLQSTDTADIQIGSSDIGYIANVTVTDGDDDGEVTLLFNTFTAGSNSASTIDVEGTSDSVSFDATNETTLNNLIDAGDYDLVANTGGDDTDVGTLALRERSTDSMNVWTAPSSFSASDKADVIAGVENGNITEDSGIAFGDKVIFQITASGLQGVVGSGDEVGTEFFTTTDWEFAVEQTNPGANKDPKTLTFNDSNADVIADAQNDTYYVVANSNANFGATLADGDEYNTTFSVLETGTLTDENQTVSSTWEVVKKSTNAQATFDSDEVTVSPAADQTISGSSVLAPGTQVTVRVRSSSSQSPFLKSDTVRVQQDGTYTATFDFSDVATGTNFTAVTRKGSSDISSTIDGTVGEGATAEVTFDDQETDGSSVVVSSVTLSEGGFVTIHDSTLLDGDALGSVVGTSEYLEAGTHEDVEVSLDSTLSEDQELIAMPHQDTNDNQEYDFVTSEGADDGPYTASDGSIVTDSGQVSIVTETATPTATPTATATPTETATPSPTTTAGTTDAPTTTTEDGPGFGALAAVIALIAAALLAVRRSN